ncbi:MAG: LysE/ArgO family amino acid transporter [Desulfobulbus sp.]|nr:LysE/ArgO family amino acid transporter [Desulfobulbus sp.]
MIGTAAITAVGQGFATGMGLIVAIGAQNSFVLSQGIRRHHHLLIALICIGCDALLIVVGIGGMGRIVAGAPLVGRWLSWIGALFLVGYGVIALRSVFRPGRLSVDDRPMLSRRAAIATTLALTLLNPHVYLDTVFLMGTLSSRHEGIDSWFFGFGAIVASTVWFFGLSLGGKILAPLFVRSISWKILDTLVCGTMWAVAWSLLCQPGVLSR